MAYYDINLDNNAATDFSTAVAASDLTMDKLAQLEALRPTYMDEHKAVLFEPADIAILSERIGLEVDRRDLRCIELRQQDGFISLHVEFTNPDAKRKFSKTQGAEHLHKAVQNLVQHASHAFAIRGERPVPEQPGEDSRGKMQVSGDIRKAHWKHEALQNESARELYASREGPPSAYAKDAPLVPRTVRQMQRALVGDPPPLVKKIQDAADRSKEPTQRQDPLLRDKPAHPPHGRLEVKRHPRVKDTPPDSEHGR